MQARRMARRTGIREMMAVMDIRVLRGWTLRRIWVSTRSITALFTCTQTHGGTMRHGYVFQTRNPFAKWSNMY